MRPTIIALIACLVLTGTAYAATQTIPLQPGDSATVTCSDGQQPAWVPSTASCPAQVPIAGQVCPKAMHDAIVTRGPDGTLYPTWHPTVDPMTGCYFGHEHGADPRTSHANAELPAFGYVGKLSGHPPEPHEGFKVFVTNTGDGVNFGDNSGRTTSVADVRVVFHMGTAGVGRYTNEHHSMLYDYVARDGSGIEAHVQGMADTGQPNTLPCGQAPQGLSRTFGKTSCADPYEIWNFAFKIQHPADPFTAADQVRFTAGGAVATFDPITQIDLADLTHLVYTEQLRRGPSFDPLAPTAQYRGCNREDYVQVIANNAPTRPGSATVYWTDAMGHVNPAGEAPGLLRQEVTQTPRSFGPLFKATQSFCEPTVRVPN